MSNRRREPVSYRPFRAEPLLADGLLPVARAGGELEAAASEAFFQLAERFGRKADAEADRAGAMAGELAALEGGPDAEFDAGAAVRGKRFAGTVGDAINKAASKHGVSSDALSVIAQIESGGNPNAKNPRSSAGGLFQFVDGTAKQYGLRNRFDPYEAADAGARLLKDNAAYLRRQLKREPTVGELYLAHQQGAGGAVKLLSNPNATAASVVGAQAVRLNGGQPGMTAGQFANLWIKKAGAGYAMPRTPDGIDPNPRPGFKVTGGRWRPSGGDTIYERAYNEAGIRTYLQMVDTEMRSTMGQAFDLYRDDPEGLQAAFRDLKGALARDQVFPEIMAQFSTGFDRMAESYLGQARDNRATRIKEQDRADFFNRTETLATEQARKVAGFDPKNGGAADAIASDQQAIDAHYDDAVSRGIMDADDAEKAKATSRRETALSYYGKQAEALDADGVAAMRKEMQADFAAGGIEGLDGEAWQSLDKVLRALETRKRADAESTKDEFRVRGDRMAGRLLQGEDINPAELTKYMLEAGRTPEGKAELQETLSKISHGRAIRDFTLKEGKAYVDGLKKQYGKTPTEAQSRQLAFAQGMLDEKRKAIAADPVTYAETQGLVPETPLLTEAETAEGMVEIMGKRVATAQEAANELGTMPRYLKAGEAKALAASIRADPAKGVAVAGAIVAGAGKQAGAVLAEFGADAPLIAESGAIIAYDGSPRAAEDVILGYGKGADGKQLKGLKPDAARESFLKTSGRALALAGKDRERIERAAASIARKRISEEGLDVESEEAAAIHAQAVNEAAGAVFDRGVQFGGFVDFGAGLFSAGTKVLAPNSIRADQFEDVLLLVNDTDLNTLPVKPKAGFTVWTRGRVQLTPAQTIRAGVPVAVDGGYAFALGDPNGPDPQFVQGDDGKIFVLDLDALRDRLEPRTPGAWR